MTVAAVSNENLSLCDSLVKGFSFVHCKYGRKLFMSKFL